ncbi:anthranilate synthase component I/chorismate-binding protein [Moraxella macacae 0408225]|uniref:Anthranilate synthase component I/chorismate-binding protein n=1 Tax=Moraxella macacae 0408225 TaxID=1230338 RepID=L2F724_9GAMM|nr:anthranilate synthase component I/chorismate-binding protein [Moraxella macacae 0408225]
MNNGDVTVLNIANQLPCEFLQPWHQVDIVKILAKMPDFYPVFLNNHGQNLIAFLPKTSFVVYFSEQPNLFNVTINDVTTNQKNKTYVLNFEQINQLLVDFCEQNQSVVKYHTVVKNHNADLNYYQNGLIGFVSYDFSAHALADLAKHSLDYNKPCAFFAHYPYFLQKLNHNWYLISYTTELTDLVAIRQQLTEIFEQNLVVKTHVYKPLTLSASWQYADYQRAFDKVQRYLYAGDCYQINLTQQWQAKLKNQTLADCLTPLQLPMQTDFSGYLKVKGMEVLSCSPELFFTFVKKNHQIELITKPIKGTRPRHADANIDEKLKHELSLSEKDIAENVMIVDLLRNDLGKYAKTGSVAVPKLFDIESFSNVHHMVSTVTATLKPKIHPMTALLQSLPAGSITGTPKKRAVEIIHELESDNRGAYCGTLGYLNFDGSGQWNVLIRTLQAYNDRVELWAGGGVTIASDCRAEYQECFDKVGNLLKFLAK